MSESLIEKAERLVKNDPPCLVSGEEYRRIISALLIQMGIQKRQLDSLRRRDDNSRT